MISPDFLSTAQALGYSPIFLVDIPKLGKYYGSIEPGLLGPWLAGGGLIAGLNVLAGAALPTYETSLYPMRQDGIGRIAYQLEEGFARTTQASFQLFTESLPGIEDALVRIKLRFKGVDGEAILFQGNVDTTKSSYNKLDVSLVDDTLRNTVPVPPQIGTDFLPRSFAQGAAIPIILGDVEFVPGIQLIGATTDVLAFEANTGSDEVLTRNPSATFPPTGTVRIVSDAGTSTVAYSSVDTIVVEDQICTRLVLTEDPSFVHPSGSSVTLVNFAAQYLLGFSGQNVRRSPGLSEHSASYNIVLDHRKLTVIESDAAEIGAYIASEARGLNLIANGNFSRTDMSMWTAVSGNWSISLDGPLTGSTLAGTARAYTEITTTIGVIYRATFTVQNANATSAKILFGTPSVPEKYYSFEELTHTTDNFYDLIFVASDAVTRITLIITGTGDSKVAFFDQFDLYDLSTENPATQLRYMIQQHIPSVTPDETSFQEAEQVWVEEGDRCAGVIQQTEEAQALLGRIAAQFRAKTFLDEDGRQNLVLFDQSREPSYRFTQSHILKDSLTFGTPRKTFTHFYVYYGRAAQDQSTGTETLGGRGAFNGVALCTPTETNHSAEKNLPSFCSEALMASRSEETLEIFADLIPNAGTAENLLSYLVRKHTFRPITCTFVTFLNAVHLKIGQFVRVKHPRVNSKNRFEIIGKEVTPNGCYTTLTCEEIPPFRFGSYTENWDLPLVSLGLYRHTEEWDIVIPVWSMFSLAKEEEGESEEEDPPIPDPTDPPGELFRPLAFADCNPFKESWDINEGEVILDMGEDV